MTTVDKLKAIIHFVVVNAICEEKLSTGRASNLRFRSGVDACETAVTARPNDIGPMSGMR
jgi:hypothetical protein